MKMKKEFDEKFRKRKNENETRLDFAIIVILYNFSCFLFTDYASYKLALDISIYREVYFLKIYSRINLLFKITIFTIN